MVEIKDIDLQVTTPIPVDIVNVETGEIKTVQATPVQIVQVVKFKTNFTDNTKTYDAEVNQKPYEIDDSMYVPLKDLLKMAERQKVPLKLVESFDGLDDNEVLSQIEQAQSEVSVDNSNGISVGDTESPTAQEVSNPTENTPDVELVSETNGDK